VLPRVFKISVLAAAKKGGIDSATLLMIRSIGSVISVLF